MTYSEAIEFLLGFRPFGMKPGLETTFRLARALGEPQGQLRFVHVAGTNGKGSTCAMLESIYRAAGMCVGLFTSPHLVRFSERIQINRIEISREELVRLVESMREILARSSAEGNPITPTFFEVATAMALRHFANEECDLVIWETGLGGRLDATNIVTPEASVITNIGLDHQAWLGDSLAAIAREKAGIIKEHVPVFTATEDPEALAVIREQTARLQAPLTIVDAASARNFPWQIPLYGDHQRVNAALALATVKGLQKTFPVSESALREGFASLTWPGRFQVITRGRQRWILDGAHNVPGISAMVETLRREFPGMAPAFLVGILRDKDCEAMLAILAGIASRIAISPVASERSASPQQLSELLQKIAPGLRFTTGTLPEAVTELESADASIVVVTGSLAFLGEVFEFLGLSASGRNEERSLNEYGGPVQRAN